MAFYPEEDDVWKCPRHPSKRRRAGVCPVCLKERLSALCPDCANLRPCSCCSTSSSSSTSSSFSFHFSDVASVGKISTLIAGEPPFRRSRSAVASSSFLRFSGGERKTPAPEIPQNRSKSSSIWSVLWPQKVKREKMDDVEKIKLRKSRSVAVGGRERFSPAAKWKSWYFPSPMNVFRQSKAAKVVVNERSPLHRG